MNIIEVRYIKDYLIEATFDNRRKRIANFRYFLMQAENPMTTQFRDIVRFSKVEADQGHLTWEDGELEVSAEDIWNGEFLHMETYDYENLKSRKEIIDHALKIAVNKTAAEIERIREKHQLTARYLELLEPLQNDSATAKLKLCIAEVPNVGVFVVQRIKTSEQPADSTVAKEVDQVDNGFKAEVLTDLRGNTLMRITDHFTMAYNCLFKVYGIVDNDRK